MCHKIRRFLDAPLPDQLNALRGAYYRMKGYLYYRRVFDRFGKGSVLFKPLLLSNPRFMSIGDGVSIRPGARIEAIITDSKRLPELRIGNNVNIEQNVHIVCHSRVVIGNNVSITGHCAIVDVTHPFHDVSDPIKIGSRISADASFVEIGDGSFIGFSSVILPDVRIGKHCVVGAHSVVTHNIPDFSVAAGNPARLISRYDHLQSAWIRESLPIKQHQ